MRAVNLRVRGGLHELRHRIKLWVRLVGAFTLLMLFVGGWTVRPDADVALGKDLEAHTERLTMIVDVLAYSYDERKDDFLVGFCPFAMGFPYPAAGGMVGFSQQVREIQDGPGDCLTLLAFETRASADVESLKGKGAKLIQVARILYDEEPRSRANPWTMTDNCVGQVHGLSGVDFEGGQPRPRVYESGAIRFGATGWDITGLVNSWFTGSAENNGLLLVGVLEPGQYGDDAKACLSNVTNVRLEVTYMREPQLMETDMLPADLVLAPTSTPTRTPGPIEREKQDVDTDLLINRTATPSPATTMGSSTPPDPGFVSKPGGSSQIVRAVTSTPTRTPEPMLVPLPRGPFVQPTNP